MSTNFFEGPDNLIFSMDIDPVIAAYASSSSSPSSASQSDSESSSEVDLIQLQIDALREAQVLALDKGKKRQQFNGVEIMQRHGPPRPGAPIPPPPSRVNGPSVPARELQLPSCLSCKPPAQSSEPKSVAAPHANPNVYGKPGTQAGDRFSSQRPQGPMCPVTLPLKPAALDPQFRYNSTIETSVKLSNLTN